MSVPQIRSPSESVSIESQEDKVATRSPPPLIWIPPANVEVAVVEETIDPPVKMRPFDESSPAAEMAPTTVEVPDPVTVRLPEDSPPVTARLPAIVDETLPVKVMNPAEIASV